MNYTLGADEQVPGLPFIRLINPTELDTAVEKLSRIIRDKYRFDWVNPRLWGLVGFDGGPVYTFLERYMLISRTARVPLTTSTYSLFLDRLQSQYKYSEDDARVYLDALSQAINADLISPVISQPYSYVAGGVELGEVAGKEVTSLINKLIIAGVSIGVIYFLLKSIPVDRIGRVVPKKAPQL